MFNNSVLNIIVFKLFILFGICLSQDEQNRNGLSLISVYRIFSPSGEAGEWHVHTMGTIERSIELESTGYYYNRGLLGYIFKNNNNNINGLIALHEYIYPLNSDTNEYYLFLITKSDISPPLDGPNGYNNYQYNGIIGYIAKNENIASTYCPNGYHPIYRKYHSGLPDYLYTISKNEANHFEFDDDLGYLCDSTSTPTAKPTSNPTVSECMIEGETVCEEFYNSYCKSCESDLDVTDEWIDDCASYMCENPGCREAIALSTSDESSQFTLEDALSMRCLDSSIDDCRQAEISRINQKYSQMYY